MAQVLPAACTDLPVKLHMVHRKWTLSRHHLAEGCRLKRVRLAAGTDRQGHLTLAGREG